MCPNGHAVQRRQRTMKNCLLTVAANFSGSAQYWITHPIYHLSTSCSICNQPICLQFSFRYKLPYLVLDVSSARVFRPNHTLHFKINNETCYYKLRGVAYFGSGHYVSRVITPDSHVWYHDGITTGRTMEYHNMLDACDLQACGTKVPSVYAYELERN
jgi:hypothetical protein